jgi:hypothetical protein
MKSYDTSIVTTNRAERIEGFRPILQEALDPFLAGCENLAKRLPSPDNHILVLNCLHATKETLSAHSFADQSEELQARIDGHAGELANATHEWFLQESGLAPLVKNVSSVDDLNFSYKDPGQLLATAQQLDAFLPSATEDARVFLKGLEQKPLVRRIVEQAAERFCEDFEGIEELVLQADERRGTQVNGQQGEEEVWLREIFPRTEDEIRVLLS